MAKNKVEITGLNTSSIKVLNDKQMKELFNKYKKGDKKAREELVNGNLKLVLSLLNKFNNRCDNLDDLFQIGCIGLLKAIDNFDLKYDVKFSTYAVPMILGEIKRDLRDNTTIRVSRSVKDLAYKILKYKELYAITNGKEPSIDEISKNIDIPVEDIVFALDATKKTISFNKPIYDDGGETIYLFDQLYDEKETSDKLNNTIFLKDAIKSLKEKEKYIILQRFLQGKTQMEISEELNVSQAQVSRIEKSALSNIKKLAK